MSPRRHLRANVVGDVDAGNRLRSEPVSVVAEVAYIGIGSNLGDPPAQIQRACESLRGLPRSIVLNCSSLYRSPPMGPADQPDYVNAVAQLETGLPPLELLTALQRMERAHGRIRTRHWGPRTLDLDLLLYGERVIDAGSRLQVPHPGIPERPFVWIPLQEIAPDLSVPGLGPLRSLLERSVDVALERL